MAQLWDTKQRQGHPLHQLCSYQGKFPSQLPAYYLRQYPDARVVLDPFCGCGTTVLEASLASRFAIGIDQSPVALLVSEVKLRCPPRAQVLDEIAALDLSGEAPPPPAA